MPPTGKRVQIYAGGSRHTALQQSTTDSTGAHLYSCDCGRAGYGVERLLKSHDRPSPAGDRRESSLPKPSPLSKEYWWDPVNGVGEERRQLLMWRLWQDAFSTDPNHRRMPEWKRKLLERWYCGLYGHRPSARNHNRCYFCQQQRKRKRLWRRRWDFPPGVDPQLRPGERSPAPRPKPIPIADRPYVCDDHHATNCPMCKRRTS